MQKLVGLQDQSVDFQFIKGSKEFMFVEEDSRHTE